MVEIAEEKGESNHEGAGGAVGLDVDNDDCDCDARDCAHPRREEQSSASSSFMETDCYGFDNGQFCQCRFVIPHNSALRRNDIDGEFKSAERRISFLTLRASRLLIS